jgi:hypothetical protein
VSETPVVAVVPAGGERGGVRLPPRSRLCGRSGARSWAPGAIAAPVPTGAAQLVVTVIESAPGGLVVTGHEERRPGVRRARHGRRWQRHPRRAVRAGRSGPHTCTLRCPLPPVRSGARSPGRERAVSAGPRPVAGRSPVWRPTASGKASLAVARSRGRRLGSIRSATGAGSGPGRPSPATWLSVGVRGSSRGGVRPGRFSGG